MQNYRLPKTHTHWPKYYAEIAALAATDDDDKITQSYRLAIEYDFPLFAMPLDTMRDLINPDLDNLARLIDDEFEPPISGFQLALPEHELYRVFGYRVSVLWVGIAPDIHAMYITYFCQSRQRHYKFSIDYKNPKNIKSYDWDDDMDYGLGYTIAGLAIQSMLLMGLRDAPVYHDPNCNKLYQPRKKAAKTRDPRWIITTPSHGQKYPCGGTGSSKTPHWRSGHWARVRVGEGRLNYRLVYRAATYVNGKK